MIEGVILTTLRIFTTESGDVLHGMKNNENSFCGFGEAYFSTIKQGQIKGWNKHIKMTLNLIVPYGRVRFVTYDSKAKNNSTSGLFEVELSHKNYQRLTIPPGLWVAFKGEGNDTSIILNIASKEHDQTEMQNLALHKIPYKWD